MSPIMGLLPGRPAESLLSRLRRDRHDPAGRTSQIHRNPRTTAIEAVYPQAIVQTCIVHMIRNSLRFTSYKDRKQLVKDLRMIYTAATEEAAQAGLETFAGIWDSRYPQISQSWRDAWERVIPYFAFPPALRRAVYTTNQIESLNAVVRKAVRVRGHFPDDESARKLVYLAIRNHESNWKRPMAGWYECLAAFHAHFQDRLTRQN